LVAVSSTPLFHPASVGQITVI